MTFVEHILCEYLGKTLFNKGVYQKYWYFNRGSSATNHFFIAAEIVLNEKTIYLHLMAPGCADSFTISLADPDGISKFRNKIIKYFKPWGYNPYGLPPGIAPAAFDGAGRAVSNGGDAGRPAEHAHELEKQ